MQGSERRVVITGFQAICAFGWDHAGILDALRGNRSGVRKLQSFRVGDLPIDCGAEIDLTDKQSKSLVLPRIARAFGKSQKYMARDITLAVVAASMALKNAGLDEGGVEPERLGIDLGAGLISTDLDDLAPAAQVAFDNPSDVLDYHAWGRDGIPRITPIWLLRYLPNMLACHISILFDCRGPSNTITGAEAAGNLAIAEAARIIAKGRADVMITGSADSKIHPLSYVRLKLLEKIAHWDGAPEDACRPFDAKATGWVPGEAAGILILEERERALARGATIHGEILGFGSGCDAVLDRGVGEDGRGTRIAVAQALRSAGIAPTDLGHVNAHGFGLPEWDRAEARGLAEALGGADVPVTALKGALGNTGSASGGIETILSLMAVNSGFVPPSRNCDDPAPGIELDFVRGEPRDTANPVFLNTNYTRLGQAAAIVVRGEPGAGV